MFKFLQIVILIAITGWVFYKVGYFLNPAHSKYFMLMGIAIAILAMLLISIKLTGRIKVLVKFVSFFSVPLIFGCMLSLYPWVWALLFVVNFPLYIFFAYHFFDTENDLLLSLENTFGGEFGGISFISSTPEIKEAWIKGLAYLITCMAALTAEYKLITYLFW